MQKIINSTSTAPGANLLRKLHEATEPPAAQRTSFFGPMFHKAATVAKGMGNVAQLALLLKAILTLVKDQVAECEREGDASGVPAKLQDWLNAGGELLKEMAGEEVGELARAARADDLRKAGKPAALAVKPPAMRAPGEGADFEAGLDLDDPRHVHALQLRQSAAAHSKLLAAIRAQYVGPPTNPSKGPAGL